MIKKMLMAFALLFSLFANQNAHAQSGYTQTKYPIVLVHGILGFDSILGVDYFYKIPAALQKDGAQVFTVTVSGMNTTELRGEQLLSQVKQIIAMTGAKKVNLVGHSHGGITVRYVAGVRPDLVASVTSIAGPNKGSKVADFVSDNVTATSPAGVALNAALNSLASIIGTLSGSPNLPQNSLGVLYSLNTAGMADFNRRFPAGVPPTPCGEGQYVVNGIPFYSWTGNKVRTNAFDISDGVLTLISLPFGSEENDGIIGKCSTHLGKVIRDNYRMNHLDEVNHVFAILAPFEVSPVTLFREHANRLKLAGL